MLALISRVWPGDKRMTVIALDQADHIEKTCYVWTDTDAGRQIADRCEVAEINGRQRIALTP